MRAKHQSAEDRSSSALFLSFKARAHSPALTGEEVRVDLTPLVEKAQAGDFGAAQDVVQDAFVAAWFSLPRLRTPAAFPGWFRSIVRRDARAGV